MSNETKSTDTQKIERVPPKDGGLVKASTDKGYVPQKDRK